MEAQYCEQIGCKSCIHAGDGKCKREYGRARLSKPTFGCSRFSTLRFCSSYEPCSWHKNLHDSWKGFDDYYEKFIDYWEPRPLDNAYQAYVLDDDESVRYYVRMADFISGDLFREDGKFKAVKKMYYKRTKKGFGYELVTEEIDGIEV